MRRRKRKKIGSTTCHTERKDKHGSMPLVAYWTDQFDHFALTYNEQCKLMNNPQMMNEYTSHKDRIYVRSEKSFEKRKKEEEEEEEEEEYDDDNEGDDKNRTTVGKKRKRRKAPETDKKEIRKVISSLDIEKKRKLLRTVVIPPNEKGTWSIGLIVNLANDYNEEGELLDMKKKVKSLTILYLTSYSRTEIESYFNTKTSVPCPNLRKYCGMLPVVLSITNIPTFDIAKQMFVYWKEGTRGSWSRLVCGLCIIKLFKNKYKNCGGLQYEFIKTKAKKTIKKLSALNTSS